MANQMIALGVKGPQTPNLMAAMQQYGGMMTQIAQQKAAARQAEQAQQKMALEAEIAKPQLAKSQSDAGSARLKFIKDFMDTSAFGIANARNAQDAMRIGEILKAEFNDPELNEAVDQTLSSIPQDPAAFSSWRQDALMRTMDASKQLEYMLPKVTTELATGETGEPLIATYGGLNAPTIKRPRSLIPAAPRAGTVEVGEQTTVAPGVGGPESVAPMMPGAKSPRLSASMASSLLGLKNNADYQVALQAIKKADPAAAEELQRIMPVFDPALSDAIREAATAEFEVIPQGGPQGLVTGERGGVGGPDEGYVEAPTPFRLKNPSVAPYPGSAQVPLPRLADEKRVEAQAQSDVQMAAERAKSKADQQRAARNFFKVSGVDLRTGKDPVADLIKRSTSGAVEALGAEFMGALPEQIGGGSTPGAEAIGELEAIAATITNTLLGGKLGTGISNEDRKMIERMVGDIQNPYISAGKRLAAWNRVKQIQKSYLDDAPAPAPAAARPAAAAASRRTPVATNIPRAAVEHLRKNPSLSAAFDAKYGKGQAAKVLGRR